MANGISYTLLSGRRPVTTTDTSAVINVTPISDVAVRKSARLADSGVANWISSPPSINWDQINVNAVAIVAAMELMVDPTVNPIDTFNAKIDAGIEAYTLESTSTGFEIVYPQR